MSRSSALRTLILAVVVLASCLSDRTGPGQGMTGSVQFRPVFLNANAAAQVDFTKVRIRLLRPATTTIVLDTTVNFPATADSLVVPLRVRLSGVATEQFDLTLAMINAVGDTVFRGGPTRVTASAGPNPAPVPDVPLVYVGVGAAATSVHFVTVPISAFFGDTATVVAVALDAQGVPIAGTPIVYTALDSGVSVPAKDVGTIVAGTARGHARIEARLFTSVKPDTASVLIQPRPVAISVASGNGQSGGAGAPLAQPIVVLAKAADSLPVAGATVNFTPAAGSGSVSAASAVTDSTGLASVTWTLGASLATQTTAASLATVPTATTSFTALSASQLVITTPPPASVTAGVPFGLVLTARDGSGGTSTGFAGNVTIALAANPGGTTLLGTTTVAATAGVATFSNLRILKAASGYTLSATTSGVAPATSGAVAVVAGPASKLAFSTQPPAATLYATPFVTAVAAQDSVGNVVSSYAGSVTLSIGTNPAGGTLSGTLVQTAVAGIATFGGIAIDNVGTGYRLAAAAAGLAGATSNAFDVTPPAGINAWINAAGGSWNTPGNWSRGVVPTALDTAEIKLCGTYQVALDVNISVERLSVGCPTGGTQTLRVAGFTMTVNNRADFGTSGTLLLDAGTIAGAGVVDVSGQFNWTGGSLSGSGGTLNVLSGGTLAISGATARNFQAYTLALAGAGTWSGAATINSGGGAVLRTLPGATFTMTGDGSFLYTLTGAVSQFVNQGTLNRTTSTGVATIGGSFNQTGTVNIASGTMRLGQGAQLGGTINISAGDTLDLPTSTDTLRAGVSFPGGGAITLTGATLTADSGSTFTVPIIVQRAGTLSHEAVLQVSSLYAWTGGTIQSNTVGLGGTTRLLSGATMNIPTTTALALQGTHTLDIASGASVNYSGSSNINTGGGATIQNAGTFTWSGDGQIPYSLGNGQSSFRNLASGTVLRSVSANPTGTGAAFQNLGTLNVNTGTLQLLGGSITNFGGSVLGSGTLELGGGAFTLTSNLIAAGNLTVSNNGQLVFGGGANRVVSVVANFATTSGGSLSMVTSTDSMDVNGNASFGGAAGTINAGVIRVAGNFTQTGVVSFQGLAQTTTVRNRVVLDGGGTQTISWANTNSFFEILEYQKATGTTVQISGTVKARQTNTSNFSTVTVTGVGAPTARIQVDTLHGVGSLAYTSPLVLEVGGQMIDSGSVNVDTVVFTGTNQSIRTSSPAGPGSYVYKSIRVAQASGTATFAQATNLTNDLVVSSGTLSLNNFHIGVTGNFATQAAGALQMSQANDSLGVGGNVSFGGAAGGVLSNGIITVKGNFAQTGAAAAFAPSGTHRTRFDLPGSAVAQTISFANPTTSFFDSLDVNRGPGVRGTVTFLTDARIIRGLSIQNSTDVTGPTARITIAGGSLTASQSTTSPTMLTTRALELSVTPPLLANMVGAVNISPDTVVINTGITTLPTASGLRYNSIRVNTGATLTMAPDTITADVHVAAGTASFASGTFQIGGKLRTTGTGTIAMPIGAAAPNVIVVDSAIFGGASTGSGLQTGTLRLRGTFTQTSANSVQAFAATTGHTTVFEGSGTQTVNFATPGVANSTFGNLFIGRVTGGVSQQTGISLASPVFVAGTLQDTSTAARDSVAGNGFSVTAAGGISTGTNFYMNNAPLVLNNYTTLSVSGLTFTNMNPAATYLTLNRGSGGGTNTISGLNFLTVPTTGVGKYFTINSNATYTLTVTSGSPVFASMAGFYTKTGSVLATVSWLGQLLP